LPQRETKTGLALCLQACGDAASLGEIVTQFQSDSSRTVSPVRIRYAQPDGASQYALARSIVLPSSPASTKTSRVCDRHHSLADRLRVRFPLCRPTTASVRVGVTEHGKSAPSGTKCMTCWPETRCCGSRTNTSASPIGLKSRHGAFQPFRSRLAPPTRMPKRRDLLIRPPAGGIEQDLAGGIARPPMYRGA
jgi:hypothetical protein